MDIGGLSYYSESFWGKTLPLRHRFPRLSPTNSGSRKFLVAPTPHLKSKLSKWILKRLTGRSHPQTNILSMSTWEDFTCMVYASSPSSLQTPSNLFQSLLWATSYSPSSTHMCIVLQFIDCSQYFTGNTEIGSNFKMKRTCWKDLK